VRHPHSRLVLSAHGSDLSFAERPGWRSKLYRAYVRTGAAAVRHAHVIANSNYIAELARKAGFERVSIVPLATDFRCASGGEQSHLLYAGRITGEKGLRFLVEEVLPRLPIEVRLRVAGAVWEKSERSVLDHPQVDYLGVLSPQQLANEFGDAAVVLIPTRTYEGFGLVAIEAGACGAWVIASNHSGLADVVEPPIGIAVAPDNAEAWVHAIESALSLSAKERAANSQAARAKVDRCYRWPRVAEATLAIYEEDRPA